jgi:hypothetical protein
MRRTAVRDAHRSGRPYTERTVEAVDDDAVDDDTQDAVVRDDHYDEVDDRAQRPAVVWSPAQLVGLVAGVGFAILGIATIARTGFDTSHIYTPRATIWHLPHTPFLGVCEIGFGALLVIAAVVPGAMRSLMGLLGVVALGFGLVELLDIAPRRMDRWFGVNDTSGWLFVIVGAVVLLAAVFSPVFVSGGRRHHTRTAVSH